MTSLLVRREQQWRDLQTFQELKKRRLARNLENSKSRQGTVTVLIFINA